MNELMEVPKSFPLASAELSVSEHSALAKAQSSYRDPQVASFAGLNPDLRSNASFLGGFLSLSGLIISASSALSSAISVAVPPEAWGIQLFLLATGLPILGWAEAPRAISWLKMRPRRRSLEPQINRRTEELIEWLSEGYGLRFENPEIARSIVESSLGIRSARDPEDELTMLTSRGAKIECRLAPTATGEIELLKARVSSPEESPYFTPTREELS